MSNVDLKYFGIEKWGLAINTRQPEARLWAGATTEAALEKHVPVYVDVADPMRLLADFWGKAGKHTRPIDHGKKHKESKHNNHSKETIFDQEKH